tara:strand:+ start:474 stop:2087 length:1614 start_codon:yes stop_codon:yes gene_type:complete
MFSPKKNIFLFATFLILTAILLGTCSETSEYGDASDYEKLGAADTISPIISSISPTDNSSDVAVATTIAVTFNEGISTGTVTTNTSDTSCSGSFQLSSDNFSSCIKFSASPTVSNDDKTFTLTPASNLSTRTTFQIKLTTSVKDANGVALESYTTNGFTTYYDRFTSGSGIISGTTLKQSDNGSLENVSVEYNINGYTKTVTSDSSGDYGIYALTEGSYTLTYSLSGYQGATQSASLASDTDNITVATLSMLSSSCSSGNISGTIKDAVTGSAISGVSVSIRSGFGVRTGSTVSGKTATSDSNGDYSISSADSSNYTVEASKTGYITSYFNTSVCGNATNQNTNMSETLPDGAMRIVLSWNGTTDLDSHLEIPVTDSDDPDSNSADSTHLFYQVSQSDNVTFTGVSTASYHIYTDLYSSNEDYVTLDQDNRQGIVTTCSRSDKKCGPETITISKVRSSGSYRFHVHNYDEISSTSDATGLADAGTYVQVFYDDTSYNFYVPNKEGNLWTVFDFNESSGFSQINSMNYVDAVGDVDNY